VCHAAACLKARQHADSDSQTPPVTLADIIVEARSSNSGDGTNQERDLLDFDTPADAAATHGREQKASSSSGAVMDESVFEAHRSTLVLKLKVGKNSSQLLTLRFQYHPGVKLATAQLWGARKKMLLDRLYDSDKGDKLVKEVGVNFSQEFSAKYGETRIKGAYQWVQSLCGLDVAATETTTNNNTAKGLDRSLGQVLTRISECA